MFVNNPETKSRIAAFDQMIEKTDVALTNPLVKQQLGKRADILHHINSNAFMPNVRDGLITLPRHEKYGANVALLPALKVDIAAGLGKHGDFAHPTPDRRQSIIKALQDAEWPQEKIDEELEALLSEAADLMHGEDVTSFMNIESVDGFQPLGGHSYAAGEPFDDIQAFYMTRSLVIADSEIAVGSIGHAASIIAHEFSHTDFASKLTASEDLKTNVIDEMYAYNVGYVIGDAYSSELSAKERDSFEAVDLFEKARQQYTSPDAPFEPTDVLIQFYIDHEGVV